MLGAAGALPTARAPPRCAAGSAGAGTGARCEGRRRQGGRRQRRGGGRGGSGHSGSKGGNGAVPKDVAAWRIFGVEVSPEDDPGKDEYGVSEELLCALQARLGANAPPDAATCRVARKSVDARRGKRPTFSYVVDVSLDGLRTCGARRLRAGPRQQPLSAEDVSAAAFCAADVRESSAGSPGDADSHPEDDVQTSVAKDVVVIGAGPAGLFAALELAEAAAAARGSNVRIRLLERGKGVEKRGRSIGALFSRRVLDADSNVCYGEGGAGTWSDGKLTTRIGRNAASVRRVLETLVRFGAPERILTSGAPHLGTDNLVRLLRAFRRRLIDLGVSVEFDRKVKGLEVDSGRVVGVSMQDGESIAADAVILAPGHSARTLYEDFVQQGIALEPKPFAMGFRVEHPQTVVDSAQYGPELAAEVHRGRGKMPVASYSLAATVPVPGSTEERSVYSFCMCPGGQVVPTSVSKDELCVNGMSFSLRGSQWANSAMVCGVGASDWEPYVEEHGVLAGLALQLDCERRAAALGGGNLVAPAQRLVDFVSSAGPSATLPKTSYRLGVTPADMSEIYPKAVTAALRTAATRFAGQLDGFTCHDAVLIGAETRTSAPVWIKRDRESRQSTSVDGLFPCGEGAGFAGGIVSAAVDGSLSGSACHAWLAREEIASHIAS